jgi:hypothetical protein
MNGRIYDYNLGRFLSVDPFIQDPGNSQSMNPYSYIMNNPLAGTDPSGYIVETFIPLFPNLPRPPPLGSYTDVTTERNSGSACKTGTCGGKGVFTTTITNTDSLGEERKFSFSSNDPGINSIDDVNTHFTSTGGTNGVASFRKYASLDDSEILQDLFGSNPETPATEIIVNKAKKVIRKATSDTIIASGLNDVDLVPSRETAHMVGSITSSVLAVGSLGPCSFACLAVANVIDVAMTFDHFNEGNIKDGILTMVPGVGAGLAAKLLKRAIIIPDAKTLKVITSLGISTTITTANALTNEEEND